MNGKIKMIFSVFCALSMVACDNPLKGKTNDNAQFEILWKNYDGSILEIDSNVKAGETPEFNKETPVKPRDDMSTYEFAGWDKEISPVTENTEYIAVFTESPRKYQIRFTNYDGSLLEEKEWDYGSIPSCSVVPKRDSTLESDYTFTGWDRNIVAVEGAAEYRAVFSEKKYTVLTFKYLFNQTAHKDEIKNDNDTKLRAGDTLALKNATCPGYDFDGWYLDALYTKKVTQLPNIQESLTLYGKFEIHTYNISYDLDEGEALGDLVTELKCTDPKFVLPKAQKTGYKFVAWKDNKGNVVEELEDVCEDISLKAFYDANSYLMTFIHEDKSQDYRLVKYDEEIVLPKQTKEGYKFLGWHDVESEDETSLFANGKYKLLRNITLVEKWSDPVEFKIAYEGLYLEPEQEVPANYPTSYNIEQPLPELPVPTRKGYEFDKWTDQDGREIPYLHGYYGIFKEREDDTLVLTANWIAKKVDIYFDYDGGSLQREITFYDGEELLETKYVSPFEYSEFKLLEDKENKQFNGWFDENNARVTFSSDKQIEDNLKLYARWSNISEGTIGAKMGDNQTFKANGFNVQLFQYTPLVNQRVTFESEGEYDVDAKLLNKSNNAVLVSDNDSAEDGKNFHIEYNLAANTTYLLKVSSMDENANGDVTIKTSTNVEKQLPEGKLYGKEYFIEKVVGEFDAEFECINDPVKEGYTFEGWEEISSNKIYKSGDNIDEEVLHLVAKWAEIIPEVEIIE